MQGIYVNFERPKSKKAIKEAILSNPISVQIEATSPFGNQYDGSLVNAPAGRYPFVGPDPYAKRNFYGTIIVRATDGRITVQ